MKYIKKTLSTCLSKHIHTMYVEKGFVTSLYIPRQANETPYYKDKWN